MSISPLAPLGFEPLLGLGGALDGHATGRTVAAYRERELPPKSVSTPMDALESEEVAVIHFPVIQPANARSSAAIFDIEHASMSISNTGAKR